MNKLIEVNYKLTLIIVLTFTIVVYLSLTIQSSCHNWDQIQLLTKKNTYLETQNDDLQVQLTFLLYEMQHFTGQIEQLALFEADPISKRIDIVQKILCDIDIFLENFGVYVK